MLVTTDSWRSYQARFPPRVPACASKLGVLAALVAFASLANAAQYSPTPLFGQERLDTWESVNRGLLLEVRSFLVCFEAIISAACFGALRLLARTFARSCYKCPGFVLRISTA